MRVSLTVALLLLTPLLVACGAEEKKAPAASGACTWSDSQVPAAKNVKKPGDPDPKAPTEVTMETSQGAIKIALDAEKAPCTVTSFLSLADQGYFDDTTCHRLVTSGIFVLQCGDPSASGSGGPGYSFKDELIEADPRLTSCGEQQTVQGPVTMCTYPAGTVAMANSGPDTNGSQFFLVYKDSPLPPAYTVFGRMSAGAMSVVNKVAAGGVAANGVAPKNEIKITSVK